MTNQSPSPTDLPRQICSAADLGKLVRARRKARKLSQGELAAAAGVGRRFVVELEQGKPSVELDKALRVAGQLRIRLAPDPFLEIAGAVVQHQKQLEQTVSKLGKAMEAGLKVPQFRLPRIESPAHPRPLRLSKAKPRSDEAE